MLRGRCWLRAEVLTEHGRSWYLSIQRAANASTASVGKHLVAPKVRRQHPSQSPTPINTPSQANSSATPPQPTPLTAAKPSTSDALSPTPLSSSLPKISLKKCSSSWPTSSPPATSPPRVTSKISPTATAKSSPSSASAAGPWASAPSPQPSPWSTKST